MCPQCRFLDFCPQMHDLRRTLPKAEGTGHTPREIKWPSSPSSWQTLSSTSASQWSSSLLSPSLYFIIIIINTIFIVVIAEERQSNVKDHQDEHLTWPDTDKLVTYFHAPAITPPDIKKHNLKKYQVVKERESIRTLCDKLRRERDRAVSELAEALRDLDEVKKNRNEVGAKPFI